MFSPPVRDFRVEQRHAFIWCRLQDGMPPATVASEMLVEGFDLATATLFVEKSLLQWRQCGLIPDDCSGSANRCDAPNATRQSIAIAGLEIEIAYSSDQLAAFVHLPASGMRSRSAVALEFRGRGSFVLPHHPFRRRGTWGRVSAELSSRHVLVEFAFPIRPNRLHRTLPPITRRQAERNRCCSLYVPVFYFDRRRAEPEGGT